MSVCVCMWFSKSLQLAVCVCLLYTIVCILVQFIHVRTCTRTVGTPVHVQ